MKNSGYLFAAIAALPASALAADIDVGNIGGITGPIAELIAPIVASRSLAADNVNAQGGLLDGDRYNLITADSACDAKSAVDAGTRLINVDQVVAVLGPSCSGATISLAQSVTIPAGVVVLSETASSPAITGLEDNDLVFRGTASDAYQGVALAEVSINAGYDRVAVTYANDDYNAALAGVFSNSFRALGGEIVVEEAHEPDRASYRSEVATLAGAGADTLVIFAYYGSSGITIIRNALETGAFDNFIGAEGMVSDELIEQIGAGNLTGKAFFTAPASDDTTPGFARYRELTANVDFAIDGPFVPNGYDISFLMALAIEEAGAADRALIGDALRKVASAPGEVIYPGEWEKAKQLIGQGVDVNYQGAASDYEFDENGDISALFSINSVTSEGTWNSVLIK